MGRMVELTGLSNRDEHRRGKSEMGALTPHLDAIVVSQSTYELVSERLPALIKRALSVAQSVGGDSSPRIRQIAEQVDTLVDRIDVARSLGKVYRPYIQQLIYTFHCRNVRELYPELRETGSKTHPLPPYQHDWNDHTTNTHFPSLRPH